MKIVSCQSPIEAAEAAEEILRQFAEENRRALRMFVPTGRTPRDLYHLMVGEKNYWATRLIPIQIDEFVDPKRLFFSELQHYLLRPLAIEAKGVYILPQFTDREMQEHIGKILAEKIDVALLGMGPNGHVGFHEPSLVSVFGSGAENFLGGRVVVSEETRDRVPGATTNEALTFGAGSFMKAEHVVLMVTGAEKQDIFKSFVESDTTPQIPATLLKTHADLTVVTDCN